MKNPGAERARIIDPGFAVADAELPSISTSDAGLVIRFRDWRENFVEAVFVDALSYRWDGIDWGSFDGERCDSSHVIENSGWLAKHLAQNAILASEDYKHYLLNFNAGGSLQVIARDLLTSIGSANIDSTSPG